MEVDSNQLSNIAAFPVVPNWYSSYAASSTNEYYVYASRNLIVVLFLHSLDYRSTFTGSLEKINAIDTYSHFCYVAGEDPVVRVWNILDGSLLTCLQAHKVEVTAIKCFREGTIVISGDKSGGIIVQEAFGSKCQFTTPVKSEITAMEHVIYDDTDYIAIGYNNGMIVTYSIDNNLELKEQSQLLLGTDSVNALSWQIINDSQTSNSWPLLASSGKRSKEISIWNTKDSSLNNTIRLPKADLHISKVQKNTNWIQIVWSKMAPNELYVSSFGGQILRYDIYKGKLKEPRFGDGHTRILFNMCYAGTSYMISTSLDKQIIKWNLSTGKSIMTIKTQSGFPYSLDISHLNPVQAVIGYGDSAIKVWKYKQVHGSGKKGKQQQPNFYESTTFWQGLRGQIERTICHPTLDGQVAFSTQYGHVGIYDIYNSKCDIFRQHHSGSNGGPSLAWAGDLSAVLKMNKNYDDDDDQNTTMIDTLITCSSDGSNTGLYLRDVNHRSRTPIDLDQVLENINPDWYTLLKTKNTIRSFVSVNPSFQYMALGNGDGSLEIYSLKTLKLIYVSNYQRSIITALHWKDLQDYSLLASGCQAGIIAIHHIKQDINIDPSSIPIIETSTYHHQREHTKTITDLKWSHHTDQVLLASSSLDNLVFVWSLEPEFKVIGCFDQHRGRVFSICWQYLEPDILFSGGEDKFVYMWNWNGHPLNRDTTNKYVPLLLKEKKKIQRQTQAAENRKKQSQTATTSITISNSTHSIKEKPAKKRKLNTTRVTETLFEATRNAIETEDLHQLQRQCYLTAVTLHYPDQDPMITINEIKNRCDTVDDYISKYISLENLDEKSESPHLSLLLGNKNDVRTLIGIELDHFVEDNETIEQEHHGMKFGSDVMGSDVKLALNIMRSQYFILESYLHAGNGMMLTDWIALALSPIAGKETWLKLMEEQANKLAEGGYHHLAATCFLACSKVYEAINVYRRASMYKEAIAMLKVRLPIDDPLLPTLLSEWAQQLQSKGNEELAALCYIQSQLPGSVLNAAHLLGRRATESSLFWSACLSLIIKDDSFEVLLKRWLDVVACRQGKDHHHHQQQEQQSKEELLAPSNDILNIP